MGADEPTREGPPVCLAQGRAARGCNRSGGQAHRRSVRGDLPQDRGASPRLPRRSPRPRSRRQRPSPPSPPSPRSKRRLMYRSRWPSAVRPKMSSAITSRASWNSQTAPLAMQRASQASIAPTSEGAFNARDYASLETRGQLKSTRIEFSSFSTLIGQVSGRARLQRGFAWRSQTSGAS